MADVMKRIYHGMFEDNPILDHYAVFFTTAFAACLMLFLNNDIHNDVVFFDFY